jgi:Leucine-rich repeat (LRR) protein
MERNNSIRQLSLARNGIASLEPLVHALKRNCRLERLDLSDNNLPISALRLLLPVFRKKDSMLTTLFVENEALGSDDVFFEQEVLATKKHVEFEPLLL